MIKSDTHSSGKIAPRTKENQHLIKQILAIYSSTKTRIGAAKFCQILLRDYDISINIEHIYRLMKSLNSPKMSTVKSSFKKKVI